MGERKVWRSSMWQRLLMALAIAATLLPLTSSAAGAEPTIEVIEAGWDGQAAGSTWTPVRVRVSSGDSDLRAIVEVVAEMELSAIPGSSSVRYPVGAYGQVVHIPAGESREIALWFPADSGPEARVRVVDGDRTLAEVPVDIELARPGWPLIGVIAEAETVERAVRSIELPYQGLPLPLTVAGLSPDSLTADPARLRALNALVVQGAVTAELTDAQRAAIEQWVVAGGHLVIAGGPSGAQAVRILPDGTLPLTIGTANTNGSTEALGAWLVESADVPANAPIAALVPGGGVLLAGTTEAPLAWRAEIGDGTVTMLAVDPGLEPFASWSDNKALLRAALSAALPEQTVGDMFPVPGAPVDPSLSLQWLTGSLPHGAHVGWPVVAIVLAGFAIVAGPVLYLALRRFDRRELSWVVVPVAAVALSAGVYAWGVQSSGRDLIANVAGYIDVSADGEHATHSIAASFYGPTHSRLSVPLGQAASVRAAVGQNNPYDPWGGVATPREEPPFRILEGSDQRVDFLEGQYDARSVMLEQEIEHAPRVTAEIGLEDGLLAGTIRNDSGLMLEDAAVAIGTTLVRLGDLAPGQSVPVRLEPTGAIDPMMGMQSLGYLLFGEEMPDPFLPPGAPPYLQVPNDPDIQRRVQMIDQMVAYATPSYFGVPSVPLTFIAYTEDVTAPDWLVPDGHPQYSLTLLRQALNLTLQPGPFVMGEGLIPGELTEVNSPWGLNWGGSDTGSWMELREGTATYVMRVPLPSNAVAEAAVLRTEQIGEVTEVEPGSFPGGMPPAPITSTTNPAEAGVFAAYDWQDSAWVDLPAGAEHRLDGSRFVGPTGEVRVRVQASDTELVRFVQPGLSIEGRADGTAPNGGAS